MNLPVITAVTAWVPDAIPLSQWTAIESALRTTGHSGWDAWVKSWHPDYGHWLEAWPGGETGGSPPVHPDLPPPDLACAVPVETGTDLSGLAAKVANAICATRPPDARPIDVIVFCHSSLDEHVSTTIAGRLCAEVGTPCFPFSLSQQHGASPFTALRLASDLLIAEPDVHTILIVAAEKWCPPFSRICGPDIVHGDAAGALLVERTDNGTGGMQLLDVAARHVAVDICRHATGIPNARTFTSLSMIDSLLARHGLRPDDIDEVVGHPGIPSLSGAVWRFLGRPDAVVQHQVCVHLGAAESIVRLAQALSGAACRRPHRVLLWGYGFGGFIGTALLETRGAPFLYRQNDVRSVS
ncbi:3-oxoacyl-ACP synthase [Paraburkholderia lacunae]|uniref:3-oxoacyl-ACP synthase n=1 Tax=Paraburkholderia lacunae TaxID=2211104 RepID=A0A370N679_9BURK|nr:3-oxoacyl-ACP synthase [Paraburkholderia lacunae]RDK01109.1 3-oxoacyl-ACP synthase [Paraburkholderia lacunae]